MNVDKLIHEIMEEEKKYREGFGYRRDNMYTQELNDLKEVYRGAIDKVEEELKRVQPMLMSCMKEYVELNEDREELYARLQRLNEKLNEDDEDEDE